MGTKLSLESLRQHISEREPTAIARVGLAMGLTDVAVQQRAEAGTLLAEDVIVALCQGLQGTRPTQLGDLLICADSIDRLDKALSDRNEAQGFLNRVLQGKLNQCYAELRTYRRVRRMLKAADGRELAEKLRALNRLLGDPRDY